MADHFPYHCAHCGKWMFNSNERRHESAFCSARCLKAYDLVHDRPSRWQRTKEWLWSLLPDKCEMQGCKRWGVRGNENIVDGKIMCDYCHSVYSFSQQAPLQKRLVPGGW